MVQGKTIFKQKKECCAGSLEGQFLRSLVQLTHATSVLEVGMFTGTSTLAMAQSLPDFGKVCALSPVSDIVVLDIARSRLTNFSPG